MGRVPAPGETENVTNPDHGDLHEVSAFEGDYAVIILRRMANRTKSVWQVTRLILYLSENDRANPTLAKIASLSRALISA